MKWEVSGADKETGEETSLVIDAPDRRAAEERAIRSGILIADVRAVSATSEVRIPMSAPSAAATPIHAHQINVGVAVGQGKGVSGFGIAALVLGIVAALVCWVPFLGLLSIPFALIGLLCAVAGFAISLVGRRSSIGMPVAGGALCALSLMIAISMTGVAASAINSAQKAGAKRGATSQGASITSEDATK